MQYDMFLTFYRVEPFNEIFVDGIIFEQSLLQLVMLDGPMTHHGLAESVLGNSGELFARFAFGAVHLQGVAFMAFGNFLLPVGFVVLKEMNLEIALVAVGLFLVAFGTLKQWTEFSSDEAVMNELSFSRPNRRCFARVLLISVSQQIGIFKPEFF